MNDNRVQSKFDAPVTTLLMLRKQLGIRASPRPALYNQSASNENLAPEKETNDNK
ncbi:MAG: hypothetical protein Q8T09_14970 [Candidatus Melainabacteria bacterium]|nr:hypothetical protein [Candidatus Melainabacteria bacterium]